MAIANEKFEELQQKILRAFANVPYPEGKVAPHECDECHEVIELFADLDWKPINPEIIEEHHGSMSLFSPEAFNYFLPAYLIYSLKHFSEDDTVCEFTIYALTPNIEMIEEKEEKQIEFLRNKFQNFTREQINCI